MKVEEDGRVLLYPSGAPVPVTLLPGQANRRGAPGAILSPDGRWLLAIDLDGKLDTYAAPDRAPLGAATESVALVTKLETTGPLADCPLAKRFSSDSQLLLTSGPDNVCVVEPEGGARRAIVTVGPSQGASDLAFLDGAASPVRVFRNNKLIHYTLEGTLTFEIDVLGALAGSAVVEQVSTAVFAPNAHQLLLAYRPPLASASATSLLMALDTETGAELWRQPLMPGYGRFTIAPDSSVVQVHGGGTFRTSDGEQVGIDPKALFPIAAIGPGGRRELRQSEFLSDWDLLSGKLLRLYGSHTESIRDLDISRDGRFLASHGDNAAVWQLNEDFAQSVPLFDGLAADDSWNVALAADGNVLAVSGDNVALFRRDGSFAGLGLPPVNNTSLDCLSADWSFSPLGSWAAGTHYGNEVVVYQTTLLEEQNRLPSANCGGGVAFSPDGSKLATASLELFDTATWRRVWSRMPRASGRPSPEDAVQFSPDGATLLVTACGDFLTGSCHSTRYDVETGTPVGQLPGLSARRARYSPEGHWVVSGNDLVHVPTGRLVSDAFPEGETLFAPNGDIIAGDRGGALVRYCRSSP